MNACRSPELNSLQIYDNLFRFRLTYDITKSIKVATLANMMHYLTMSLLIFTHCDFLTATTLAQAVFYIYQEDFLGVPSLIKMFPVRVLSLSFSFLILCIS